MRRTIVRPVQRLSPLVRIALAAAVPLAILASAAAAAPLPPGSLGLALGTLAPGSPLALARAEGVTSPSPMDGTICYFGACYNYVAGRQYAWYATGAGVQLWRGRPKLDPADVNSHSLQELAVQSVDGLQIVEVGW